MESIRSYSVASRIIQDWNDLNSFNKKMLYWLLNGRQISIAKKLHKMNIQEIIQQLKISQHQGFQLEKRNGVITSTWLIYKRNGFYFYFDINQKIAFADDYKYSENEILEELKDSNFKIDLTID